MTEPTTLSTNKLSTSSNWPLWKVWVRAALNTAGIGRIITGTDLKPVVSFGPYKDTWDAQNSKALLIIVNHLDDRLAMEFEDADKARTLYDALVTCFEKTNTTSITFDKY